MKESRFLDTMETPRELTRARRRAWSEFAKVVAACTLAFGGLELLYNSALLPTFGLRTILRPYWHYITAVPVVIAALWFLRMVVTVPVFRRRRAHVQHLMDLEHPDVLQRAMRRRYERTARDIEEYSEEESAKRRELVKSAVTAVLSGIAAVVCHKLPVMYPGVLEFTQLGEEILALLLFGSPYIFGIVSFAHLMGSWEHGSEWLEVRARVREHEALRDDLATVRRELHGDATGALSTLPERHDDAGDMTLVPDKDD